jgi:hypothetical protein
VFLPESPTVKRGPKIPSAMSRNESAKKLPTKLVSRVPLSYCLRHVAALVKLTLHPPPPPGWNGPTLAPASP